ncbi:MAG: hypothetical protein MK010_05265 [Erythrobacter sp.]|nr:hypothetical protein [Erythrobacter sp.]
MPIWFEITVMMLTAYGLGVAAGWALWNRAPSHSPDFDTDDDSDGDAR